MQIRWDRIDPAGPGLHQPKKAGDIGFDLEVAEDVEIAPGEAMDVPTNVRLELPDTLWVEVRARSSIARRGLQVEAGTIDPGYRGPLFALVRNLAQPFKNHHGGVMVDESHTVVLNRGERVAQVVFHRVCIPSAIEVDAINMDTQRGTTGFGSTGT